MIERRMIGSTDDGWMLGYDVDQWPIVWRAGEPSEAVDALADYGDWHLLPENFGALVWCDRRGQIHRPDGSID